MPQFNYKLAYLINFPSQLSPYDLFNGVCEIFLVLTYVCDEIIWRSANIFSVERLIPSLRILDAVVRVASQLPEADGPYGDVESRERARVWHWGTSDLRTQVCRNHVCSIFFKYTEDRKRTPRIHVHAADWPLLVARVIVHGFIHRWSGWNSAEFIRGWYRALPFHKRHSHENVTHSPVDVWSQRSRYISS